MQHVNTPFNKFDKDNSNLITLDMGMSTDRVTVHIQGMIVKETVKGKIIDSNTVEFTKGQAVKFQFIPGIFVMGVNVKNIMGGGVLLAIGCGAFVFYRRRNDKKREVA